MPNYGICCACGEETESTRNFVLMERLAPVKGSGWGCENCGLPPNGAVAVVCDKCLEDDQSIVLVVHGDIRENKRIAYHQLEPGKFEHDMSKHPKPAQQEIKPQGLPTEDEFRTAFKEMSRDKQPIIMSMLNWQGWCLLTAIQLVSTHPDAKNNPTIQVAVKVGRRIEQLIVGDSPRFALTARAGWKREESSIPLEELAAVMEQRGKETIELVVSKDEAWSLISAAQLASRHPEYFDSPHMPIVHGIALQLQDVIAEKGSVLARVATAGWDANYDQPI